MRSFATLVTVLVVVASGPTLTSAQQSGALRIGSAAARAGEKGSGFIVVPAGIDSGTRIPLTIVRGKDPGPTLALIAGTHGDEVAPVIALQRVRRELDPARLAGTVLLVQVANLPSLYTQNTAHLRGKPALTTEAGYLGLPAEDMIARNEQGAFRLLRYLKMIPGDVELVRHPLWFDRTEVLRSPGTGIWYPQVERGHTVQKGTVIGVVTDFFGDTTAAITAPFAGVMLYVVATPAISEGEPLGMVGRPVEER